MSINNLSYSDIISSIALSISFLLAIKEYWHSRAQVDILQIEGGARSCCFSFDGWNYINAEQEHYPDAYWGNEFRVLIEVVITNKSSRPLSIIEFILNDTYHYNSYSEPGSFYSVSTEKSTTVSMGTEERPLNYLNPNFTLDPYTSKRGYLFFNTNDSIDGLINGQNDLTIISSRKNFKKKVLLTNFYTTIYPIGRDKQSLLDAIQENKPAD